MRFLSLFPAIWLALATLTLGSLHDVASGLLQVPPAFAGDAISLFPAHHPDHDPNDLKHLLPDFLKELHFSQEGHRSALHGSKHAFLKAKYSHPTVVLEHSNQVKSIQCSDTGIKICFKSPQALETVQDSWARLDSFNVVAYHLGCGHQGTGKRSYWHASQPVIQSDCVILSTQPIEEGDAMESGEISWGTYESPTERRRTPVKGHVRAIPPAEQPRYSGQGNGTATVDLTEDPKALKNFFHMPNLNTTHMNGTSDEIAFAPMSGDLSKRDGVMVITDAGSKPEEDIWEPLKKFGRGVGQFFVKAGKAVVKMAKFIGDLVDIGWDLAKVPFGYPFERTYHEDFKLNETLRGEVSTKVPQIFGHENGYALGKDGKNGNIEGHTVIQCARCSAYTNFNLYGRLAFDIKNGITDGTASFINTEPLKIETVFGITANGKYSKTWEKEIPFKQPNPVQIPGLLTLGPMVNVNVAFTLSVEGEAELLIGGSVIMAAGKAEVSLVDRHRNGISGLGVTFTPEFKANGTLSVTGELGLPVTVELGIDVFDGKYKKTAGVTFSPAVYLKSIVSTKSDNNCREGVELRAGVKSPIVFQVLGLFKSDEFFGDPIYERGLTCITKDGFDPSKTHSAKGIIADVIGDKGKDITAKTPQLTDATANFTYPKGPAGFRIVMTRNKEAIMVSGTDGNIYLVEPKAEYDFSAPWATTDTGHNVLATDTFGRLIAIRKPRYPLNPSAIDLIVAEPEKMPKGASVAGIAELATPQKGLLKYAVVIGEGQDKVLYFPTVCLTGGGLRLVGTLYAVIQESRNGKPGGKVKVENPMGWGEFDSGSSRPRELLQIALKPMGINVDDCMTVQLTSHL